MLVIGDEDAAVAMEFQSVRLAIVFGDERKLPLLVDAKNAAPGNVHAIEISVAVESRSLEQGMRGQHAGLVLKPF